MLVIAVVAHEGASPGITDWITAVATVFAAIGTVGAVVVALWQSFRSERRSLKVTCREAITPHTRRSVALHATNNGHVPIKVSMASASTPDHRQVVIRFAKESNDLPRLLQVGEAVDVFWAQADVDAVKAAQGGADLTYAFFSDTMGNIYSAAFPGARRVRRGLRRRIAYELDGQAGA